MRAPRFRRIATLVSAAALLGGAAAAMQASRPDASSSPQDMAATLAKALGLTTAKVQAAMDATMPGGGGGGAPPATPAPTG